MNLISCPECGVVYDKDKITFPGPYLHDDSTINTQVCQWDGDKWIRFAKCRVCQRGRLLDEDTTL